MATAIHQYEDKLLDFAYGELPAPEASALESHLKSCARCSQALAQIRGVRTVMSALPQVPAPTAGLESLLAYAEQAAARNATTAKPAIPWWRRYVAPLAGALALSLVAVVAVKTQKEGGLEELSAEKAALDATPRKESPPIAAAPVLAPPPAPEEQKNAQVEAALAQTEPQKVAQKMKAGKTSGAMRSANWADKDDAPSGEGYSQALGGTAAQGDGRQVAQRKDLGDAVANAKKSDDRPADDYSNSRGAYVQEKKAKALREESNKPALGLSAPDARPTVPAPSVAKAPAPPPAAEPTPSPKEQPKSAPSLGVALGSSSGPGTPPTGSTYGGGGSKGGLERPVAYKQEAARANEDEIAERGASDLSDRKRLEKDVQAEARDQDTAARRPLEAARVAGNQGNRQEEVKQALAVLQTNVQGAPRAEALNRLCLALQALDNEAQADKYCAALIREFPNTAAAKSIASRRSKEPLKPAPASKTRSYDAESATPDAPAEKKSAPASAY